MYVTLKGEWKKDSKKFQVKEILLNLKILLSSAHTSVLETMAKNIKVSHRRGQNLL